jgi:serine/threonine protein kinase
MAMIPDSSGASEEDDEPVATVTPKETALFYCCELVLGRLLGKGAFCEVHDLMDLRLLTPKERRACERSPLDDNPHEHAKRVRFACQKHDPLGNPRYVVKHLRPDLSSQRGVKIFHHAALDCLKEFDILSKLSHPNIIELCGSALSGRTNDPAAGDSNAAPGTFFIVLEKVDDTLSGRIRQWIVHTKKRRLLESSSNEDTKLPAFYVEKLRYARDIASAIAHVHKHGMVFRDLKPDNIGIARNGSAKLFDFGLCRTIPTTEEESGSTNKEGGETLFRMSTVGTRRYMSPEMIVGAGYNQKTDCYSWAMVFYEMLSLQKPYARYNRAMHKVLLTEKRGRPSATGSNIPWNSRDLLTRSWAHHVSDRPTAATIVEELEAMMGIVEQQSLPLIERSIRAVSEMAELFSYQSGNCLAEACTLCVADADEDLEKKSASTTTTTTSCASSSPHQKLSTTELSITTTADRGVVAAE